MSDKPLYCSFCSNSQYEVDLMIAGMGVNICDECVDVCADALAERREVTLMCIGDLCTEYGQLPATRMMPQSSDGGRTYEMEPCCDNHAAGWWDGADWDGRHLEAPIVKGVKNRH